MMIPPVRMNKRLGMTSPSRVPTIPITLATTPSQPRGRGTALLARAINSHIHNCMSVEASTQRHIEKGIKREGLKSIGRKLGGFFIPKKKEPMILTECPHTVTVPFFDLSSERVHVRCRQCGKVLSGSVDPHKKQKRRRKDLIVYGSLKK